MPSPPRVGPSPRLWVCVSHRGRKKKGADKFCGIYQLIKLDYFPLKDNKRCVCVLDCRELCCPRPPTVGPHSKNKHPCCSLCVRSNEERNVSLFDEVSVLNFMRAKMWPVSLSWAVLVAWLAEFQSVTAFRLNWGRVVWALCQLKLS